VSDARIVIFLFTDIVGSTELYDRLGDETAEALRRAHFRLLREAMSEHGGHEVKNVGDGLMVVFPSAVDAVSCGIAMQRAVDRYNRRPQTMPLEVRIGLHAGEPIHDEEDYFGASVNVAKRLCDGAEGGQIIASDLVRGLIGGREGFAFRTLGPLPLRGITEPLDASEVLWTPATASAFELPAAFAGATRTSFVGRENEREALRNEWKRAVIGERRLVFLAGEPGIGKTRLSVELAREAHADGAIVLYGRCDPEAVLPYQPFLEALRSYVAQCPVDELREQVGDDGADLVRLVPELTLRIGIAAAQAPGDPESERYRLFRSVAHLLGEAARIAPVLVICDDLHWADAPTLAMLKHVMRGEAAPILVCGTYRDVEITRHHPLADVLASLYREHIGDRIALRGLTETEVESFVAAAAEHELDAPARGFARALHAETQGNPFFIEEILLHLVETGRIYRSGDRWTSDATTIEALGIPEGVREAVERRLARLDDDCRTVLTNAAVVGPTFDFLVLRRMLPDTDDDHLITALEHALDAQLVTEAQDARATYTFVHAIVRQVLYDELSQPRRERLHLAAAAGIEAVQGTNAAPESLAVHYRAAGSAADPQRTIEVSLAAAQAASAVFAYEDAAGHLDAAIDLMERNGAPLDLLARMLQNYGDLMFITGLDYGRGIERVEKAVRLYTDAGDEVHAAQARSRLGRALSTFDTWMQIDNALDHFRAAEAVLSQHPPSAALAHAYMGLASATLYGLRTDEGLEAATKAQEIAAQIGREGIRATALALRGFHTWARGDLAEGMRLIDEGWEAADRLDHPTLGFISTWMACFIGEMICDPRPAEEWCERELSRSRTQESPTQRVILRLHRDMVRAQRGDIAALAVPHENVGADTYISSAVRAQYLEYHVGNWRRTAELGREAVTHRIDAANRLEVAATSHTLAWTLRLQNRLPEAEAVLRDCLPYTTGMLLAAELMERPEIAVACVRTGRIGEARAEVDRCREIIGNGEDWKGRAGWVDWAAGVLAAADDPSAAAAYFAHAADTLGRHECVIEQAEVLYWWGLTLVETGDATDGNNRLDAAIEIYRRAGAGQPFIDRALAARA
jgi:class 3 adenylate cyclase/tetratricopeptide (TPR) repeat protein